MCARVRGALGAAGRGRERRAVGDVSAARWVGAAVCVWCGQVDAGWTARVERPYDAPLTQQGRAQAASFGTALAEAAAAGHGPPLDVVVTSPFLRCVQACSATAPTRLQTH